MIFYFLIQKRKVAHNATGASRFVQLGMPPGGLQEVQLPFHDKEKSFLKTQTTTCTLCCTLCILLYYPRDRH